LIQNFIFSINIVAPLFIILFLGYSLKRVGFLTGGFLTVANKFVFYIALPLSLFRSVFSSNIDELIDVPFIVFAVSASVLSFFVIWLVAAVFIKDKAILGAFVQGAFRGNIAFVGLPLLANLAGDFGVTRAAIFITFVTPLYNIFSIMLLTATSRSNEKIHAKTIIFTIIKNPILIGVMVGIVFVLLGVPVPSMINTSLGYVANMATPMALLCLGAGIGFNGFDKKFYSALVASIIKVAVLPFIFTAAGYLLGFRGYELAALMVLGVVPSAISGHAMVIQMGGDEYVSGTIVVLSTLMSLVTMTLFIYFMRVLGLI